MSFLTWIFRKIRIRCHSNFDNLPAVGKLSFWGYFLSFRKSIIFLPRSPTIKRDKNATFFIASAEQSYKLALPNIWHFLVNF